MLTYGGKTLSVRAWARELGISRSTIRWRIQNGRTVEQVLSVSIQPVGRRQGGRLLRNSSKNPIYSIWRFMIRRCTDRNSRDFCRYGARGIVVCPRWLSSFDDFANDVGPRPSLTHSLDRIDNDGDYEPGNVRWATRKEQARNCRTSKWLVLRGERFTQAELAERFGVPQQRLYQRLKRGWSLEEAIAAPANETRRAKAVSP